MNCPHVLAEAGTMMALQAQGRAGRGPSGSLFLPTDLLAAPPSGKA